MDVAPLCVEVVPAHVGDDAALTALVHDGGRHPAAQERGEVCIDPDHLLIDEDKAVEEATYFAEASKRFASGGTIVDMCPASSGRGVEKLKRVVDRVPNLQVIQATGFHQQQVYLEWRQSWVNQYSVTEIANLVSCVAGASLTTIQQVCKVAEELGGEVQAELADMGFTVTITGGVSPKDLPAFAGRKVGIVISGRAIVGADDPAASAKELRDTIHEVWS